jgi:hypothetical protein
MTAMRFIGKEGKYQIPKNAVVSLLKTYPKRKCLILYNGVEYITFVTLLRKDLSGGKAWVT